MTASPSVHRFQVPRTARLAILGTPAVASVWWIVLHGYGQLAADFVAPFESVATTDRCVIAPEALSRFYVDRMNEHEQVGASWMTREDRSYEIDDYIVYLDGVIRELTAAGNAPSVAVLGFSQGAATASRWALLGDTDVDRLVLWGGAPAHDLDLAEHADHLRRLNLTLVSGTNDPYVSENERRAVQRRLDDHDVPATYHTFDGGHRIDRDTLGEIVAERP